VGLRLAVRVLEGNVGYYFTGMSEIEPESIYHQVGGHQTFERLCNAFYGRVEKDSVLRPLYPDGSLDESKENLALFLTQFFGGPDVYSQRRGHPRLRARHLPFAIGRKERDVWVMHMLASLDESGIVEPAYSQIKEYFQEAATFLINKYDDEDEDESSINLTSR
jgi:hemoglobin